MYQATLDYINSKINNFKPEIAVVLGSGLGSFCDGLNGITLKYSEIPNFASTTVHGHKGELIFSNLSDKNIVIMQGRFHYYEGNSLSTIVYPIKIFKKLGVKTLILTNAAGAVNKNLNIGDVMLIEDHINFMGINPLIGKNDDTLGLRFPDMSDCYSQKLQELAFCCAKEINYNLKSGVYLAVSGPSYETKAEVLAYKTLGADVIGMSTVPEVIVSNYLGMNTLGFSLVTNYCTGVNNKKLSHDEVIQIGKLAGVNLVKLIKKIIEKL